MSHSWNASAPGKLFVLGEYAVLESAPAVVWAVEPRAQVHVAAPSTGCFRVAAPQLGIRAAMLRYEDGGIHLTAGHDAQWGVALRVVMAVMRQLAEADALPPAGDIHIDTAAFYRHGSKLGLGSSAAVAAALTAALAAAASVQLDPAQLLRHTLQAHREAQGGVGSGADVAASVTGGVVSYRRDQPPQPLSWPEDLFILPIVAGGAASTPDLVEQVQAWKRREPAAFADQLQAMEAVAQAGVTALQQADVAAFVQCAADYGKALARLGERAGAPIVSAEHAAIAAAVESAGGAYKPSGAGGGDFGIALAATAEQRDQIDAAVRQAGFEPMPLERSARGVAVEIV